MHEILPGLWLGSKRDALRLLKDPASNPTIRSVLNVRDPPGAKTCHKDSAVEDTFAPWVNSP